MSDEAKIKAAVLDAVARSLDAGAIAAIAAAAVRARPSEAPPRAAAGGTGSAAADRVLSRVALGDILGDDILGAKPGERTFPLRLLFSELATWVAREGDDGAAGRGVEAAFCFASGLNFYFRTTGTDEESRVALALETSRAFYRFAREAPLDGDLVGKAAPVLAALMSGDLSRAVLEAVDHVRVFDSQIHDRAAGADPTGARVISPVTFLCRVASSKAVKVKAQVLT
ncbi:MAG: hypothetical protein KC657_18525 [Myxococcales bacterium]|nr:hypothetical protein [Myxococcales bacterium]